MKKIALALASAFAFATPSLAADLGRQVYKAPVVAAVPVYNWTGFYIGAHAGYVWGDARLIDVDNYNGAAGSFSYNADGFLGGGHAGYNWQMNMLVLGVEVEAGYMGLSGSAQFPPFVGVRTPNDSRAFTDPGWYAAFTGRLGFAVNNWLFYAKGGWAVTGVSNQFIDTDPIGITLVAGTRGPTRDGWTAGGGIEYGFSNNWSARIEYAHYDFGTVRHTATSTGVPAFPRFDHPLTADSVRIGISYRFGWAPPLVASY